MNKKKLLIDILFVISIFVLFVVWYNSKNKKVTSSPLQNETVYLISMDKTSEYWNYMDRGAKDMARLLGVKYIWDAPKKRNVDEQIKIFNNAVNAGANVIMLAASDPDKLSGEVENAKAKGVKVIYVDAPAAEEAIVTIATDNYSAGRLAGETMLSELDAVGVTSGSLGIIGVTPENITTLNREKGFQEVIKNDGRFRLLDTKYAQEDYSLAQKLTEEYINENSDLVGIFSTNEASTIGVGNAIKNSNKKMIGIGFDITEEIQEMLKNDILQAVLVQNPYTMGYLGVAEAVAALKGYKTGPSFINTGISLRTKYSPKKPGTLFIK